MTDSATETDYGRCLVAADGRLEYVESQLNAATSMTAERRWQAQRQRLGEFATFCQLAMEFTDE